MKKTIFLAIFLLSMTLAVAHSGEIEEGKILVESNVSCNNLNDEQLEAIGEYYMEQMHPGEAHELMDRMMGGEDSESLKQMHIQMAKNTHCGESTYGMMGNGMMNMMGSGMMGMAGGSNMMNAMGYGNNYGMMGYGGLWSLWGILWFLIWLGILALIVWAIYKLISQGVKGEDSMEIIKKRYAKGEITKKEFGEMRKEIEK